eukprot:gene632-1300_t
MARANEWDKPKCRKKDRLVTFLRKCLKNRRPTTKRDASSENIVLTA